MCDLLLPREKWQDEDGEPFYNADDEEAKDGTRGGKIGRVCVRCEMREHKREKTRVVFDADAAASYILLSLLCCSEILT